MDIRGKLAWESNKLFKKEDHDHSHLCIFCGKDTKVDCLVCNKCIEVAITLGWIKKK